MKIISTQEKPISIDALDLSLAELLLDYEVARRIGGNLFEVSCLTFKNEAKRDAGLVIVTNVLSLKMIIEKKQEGIFIRSNFSENEQPLLNKEFELTENFIQHCIKKVYEDKGYTVEL